MKNIFLELKKLAIWQLAEFLFYPIILLYRVPMAWIKTLAKSRVLLDGKWSRYMGFHPRNSLNSFFYRTQWLNIDRYGRTGTSLEVGLGKFHLSGWFHLSNFSSYVYANAGAVTTLVGTFVWGISHINWIISSDPTWVALITLTLLFSSTGYAMAFSRQNYNILGWLWLPTALFASINSIWLLAVVAWLGASIGSITVVILGLPIIFVLALESGNIEAIFTVFPALIILALHLRPLLVSNGDYFSNSVLNIAKLIGAHSRGVRYKRHSMRFTVTTTYFLFVYVVSILILYFSLEKIPLLPITAVIIFLINQRLLRIADDQSVILLFVTVMGAYLLTQEPNAWALLALWLAASPLPCFLSITSSNLREGLTKIVCHGPFDHDLLEENWDQFFSQVPVGSRIYFAFNNPGDHYEKIFDGYRAMIELPLYVASKRKVHLFPDWHAVGETNYPTAPNCWGRDVSDVLENLESWNAKFAIIYHDAQKTLDEKWTDQFTVIAEFDWSIFAESFQQTPLCSPEIPTPKFYLLKLV